MADHAPDQVDPRPLVGVSRCLLGDRVRYDGASKRTRWIVDVLSLHCDFLPLCPEVEAGLGIPRPPVRLVGAPERPRVLGVADSRLDVTQRLNDYIARTLPRLETVNGMILKSRSPSCGVSDTPVFAETGEEVAYGGGLFTRAVRHAYPVLPVIDENDLESEAGRVSFLIRVFRHRHRQMLRFPERNA